MRTLLVLLSTLLSSGLLFAQALTYPADCMVALLGRQPNDPEVEQVLAQAGILIPGDRKGSFDNLAQGYSMVLSATGAINSITFYNDSVKVGRKLYQGYKGALPFGFTFADSLGVEENLIFNQATTSYFEHDNYNRAHVPARTQKGLDYFIDCQYVAASQWYYMKQVNRAYRQRRTQWYRFSLATTPHKRFLTIPVACSGETGSLQTGSSFAAADSAFYLEAYLDIRTLNRVTRGRSDLGGGGGFGLQIKAPFSKTLGPPLHHLFFLNFAGYSYTKLAIIDPQPTLNTVALGYGLQVFPTNSIRIGRAVTPFAQITGSGVLVYSDRIADEQGTIANAKTNVRLQYEVGGGIAGDVRRFASFYAGVFYQNLDNVNYYRVTTAGTETTIDTKKTDLQGINIRFGVSLRLVGLVGE